MVVYLLSSHVYLLAGFLVGYLMRTNLRMSQ